MDAGCKSFLLQRKLKQETEQVHSYLQTLKEWTEEMNEKEAKALTIRDSKESWFADELDWPIRLQKNHQNNDDNDDEKHISDEITAESEAQRLRERGNIHFRNERWDRAIQMYSACIVELRTQSEHIDAKQLSIAHSNRAAAYLKAKKYQQCCDDCSESLKLDSLNEKALFRRGTAMMAMGKRKKASKDWSALITLYSDNNEQSKLVIAQKMQDKCLRKKKTMIKDTHNNSADAVKAITLESSAANSSSSSIDKLKSVSEEKTPLSLSVDDHFPSEKEILTIDSFLTFEKLWKRCEGSSKDTIRAQRSRLLSVLCSQLSGHQLSELMGIMVTQQLLSDFIDSVHFLMFADEWPSSLISQTWDPRRQSIQQRSIDAFNQLSKFRSLERFAMLAAFLGDHSSEQLSEMKNHLLSLFQTRESFSPKIQAVFDSYFVKSS